MIRWMLVGFASGALIVQLFTVILFLLRLRRAGRMPKTIGLPHLTLLRPVCGRDAFDEETLGSSFTQNYPAYDIIFCAPSEGDPVVPIVIKLMAAYPHVKSSVLFGEAPITGNPKLNNLWKGWLAAKTEWVCMTDSNLLLPPHYLTTVVSTWGPKTGLVSSPPVGERPVGFAGCLECAFLNGNQARIQFAADSLGHGFAQGKTLFWNRDMLNRAGGLAAIGRYLAEDVNSTKLVRAQGLRVSLTPTAFAQPIGQREFKQVWNRQLRWSRVRRDGFPVLFAAEILNGPALAILGLLLASILFNVSLWGAGLFVALWYGAEVLLMHKAGWPSTWRDIAVLPLRDALLPVLWVTTFFKRTIEWRGTAMARPVRDENSDLVLDTEASR
jgi:ceramide glucosyltransferase